MEGLQETSQPRTNIPLCDDSDSVCTHPRLQLHKILYFLQDRQEENLPEVTLSFGSLRQINRLKVITIYSRSESGQKRLDSAWVHHDSDPLSHGLWRKVASELGPDGASISVGSGDLAPDNSHLRLVGAPGNAGLVLGLVHVGAPLANVPP